MRRRLLLLLLAPGLLAGRRLSAQEPPALELNTASRAELESLPGIESARRA